MDSASAAHLAHVSALPLVLEFALLHEGTCPHHTPLHPPLRQSVNLWAGRFPKGSIDDLRATPETDHHQSRLPAARPIDLA